MTLSWISNVFDSEFWQIWPKLNVNIPCDSDESSVNELFVSNKQILNQANASMKTLQYITKAEIILKK